MEGTVTANVALMGAARIGKDATHGADVDRLVDGAVGVAHEGGWR